MRIAAGIGLVILFFVFFAQASIKSHFDSEPLISAYPINDASEADIPFHESVALKITVPAYQAHRLAPNSKDWMLKTIDPLVDFLKTQNEKVLLITGSYLEIEKENSIGGFNSMGQARAGFIANELIKKGISPPRIILRDRLVKTETLNSPLQFEFFNDGENIP